ncbi:MAG: DUF4270 family protein [Bacteroidota bacterium]
MKKHVFAWLFLAAGVVLLSLGSCTESSPLGAELVDQDKNQVEFQDTVTIEASTVDEGIIRTYSPDQTLQLTTYMFGNLVDPIFGSIDASFYSQFRYSTAGAPSFQDDGITLDSLVLMLEYDSSAFYGNVESLWNIEVYELSETMDPDATYYSDQAFATVPSPIGGAYNFMPNYTDSIEIIRGGDTTTFIPHLRIRLDDVVGQRLLDIDSVDYADINLFLDQFKGINVRTTSPSEGLLAFSLNTSTTRMALYYSVNDTTKRSYTFDITGGSAKSAKFEHQYEAGIVFNDKTQGDSLLFIQGLAGPLAKLEFPHIQNLQNVIINKAELEFTLAVLPDDDIDLFPPSPQLILVEQNDDDEYVLTEDVAKSVTPQNRLDTEAFGGDLQSTTTSDGTTILQYKMNMAARLQDMIDGSVTTPIFVRSFTKPTNGSRVVLYGPGHSQFPLKLNLIYTNIN